MVKVSIIVPVYNGQKYIKKCLDSLLNQTLKDIEVIVVDDGSIDQTLQIINNISDERLKVISIENQGQGVARNIGITFATGDYLGFVDSDDYIDRTMFEKLYKTAIEQNSDLVICPYYRVDEVGKILFSEMKNVAGDYLNINTSPWNKLYRRSLWSKYDIKFAENLWYEDLHAVLPFVFVSNKIDWINEPLYYYVQRKESSINIFNERVEDIFKVFDGIYKFIECNKLKVTEEIIQYYFIMHLVFGHLSRCSAENIFLKRHKLIINTKKYLLSKFPNFLNNYYFTLNNIDKKPFSMFLIKYIGFKMFKYNIFDYFILLYRFRLKLSNNIKRW